MGREGGGFKRELTGPALGMLAVGFVVLLTFTTPLYRQIELKTLDMRFGLRPELRQSDLILHIDIDDSSISRWGRWPWPRDRHADLVRTCKELGAREVIFDVEFPEPSSPEEDNAFAAGLHETGFSFLPFRLSHDQADSSEEEALRRRIRGALLEHFDADAADLAQQLNVPKSAVDTELVGLKKSVARTVGRQALEETGELTVKTLLDRLLPKRKPFVESVEQKVIIPAAVDHCLALKRIYEKSARLLPEGPQWERIPRTSEIEVPIDVLTRNAVGFGASNAPTDAEDGMLRHVSLFFVREDRLLPHLSLVTACRALATDVTDVEVVPGSHITLRPGNDQAGSRQPIIIPIDDECRMIINWAGNRRTAWNDLFLHAPYGLVRGLNRFRENIADNERVLGDIYRDNDRFVGGKWTRVNQEVTTLKAKDELSAEDRQRLAVLEKEQQDVEDRIRDFLVRNTASEGQDDEERELIKRMRYYLAGIDELRKEQERLQTNMRHVREQLERLIRDRLCIVGSTESASTDLKPTPIHPLLPGVGVHSAVVNSILQRRFVRQAPEWVNVVFIVAAGLGVSVLASYLGMRWAAVGTLSVIIGWSVLTFLLFWLAGWWVAMAGPVMAAFLAYAAITAYRQLTEERQKRHIRNTFHHYLAPAVVAEVLKNPDALKLGGERKELTVFFSDVAGFTPIAEHMEPEELVALLNDYLSEMSDVILQSKGYINKYEGDAIMAVFGAPLYDPQNAAAACRVALESQHRLKDFRARLAQEKRPIIRARIGINSGIMIVGNMGSRTLFDYTVMGDNVNIGARLENANKHFGTEIIIGENTFAAVRDTFETRRLGLVHVKGRTKPVGAYELLAEKGKCPPVIQKLLPHYNDGLAAYAEQRWDAAITAFTECLAVNDKDGPSRAYLDRCRQLAEHVGVEHWDGTFTLET